MKAEWLLIIIPVLMLFLWALWYNLTNKWYNWRYKPENDKARPGKGPTGPAQPEEPGIGEPTSYIPVAAGTDAGSKLETANPVKTGQNSKSTRGFFATRRRTK
jgi:hypothetical protein